MDKIMDDINNICEEAINDAMFFSKRLDFSENSLKDVEDILELYHKDIIKRQIKNAKLERSDEHLTPEQIWSMAMMWGVYVGEVMRRNIKKELVWVYEDAFGEGSFLHLKAGDKNRIFPIGKVFKRLNSGKEEDIIFFYEVFKKELS